MSRYTDLTNWYVPSRGIRFRATKDVCWEIGALGSGLWLIVPAGYEFDVSIPWVLRWALSPRDRAFLKAGALHDYALHELGWTRVAAAAAFSEALRVDGVSRWIRLPMVLGVIVHKFT